MLIVDVRHHGLIKRLIIEIFPRVIFMRCVLDDGYAQPFVVAKSTLLPLAFWSGFDLLNVFGLFRIWVIIVASG